ncbi:MAG: NADH-quinone oxidoreductase subunit J [Buchnera aphidicola (Meitanaphis microgallis)]
MEFSFYSFGLMSIIFTILTIFSNNPMHALIYLTLSFLCTSGVFFSLGAFFAAALEVIIYAGAIMVLFVFIIMMFNFNDFIHYSVTSGKPIIKLMFFFMLALVLIIFMIFILSNLNDKYIFNVVISTHEIGMKLFSDYVLVIELASMLLLSALVVTFHIGKNKKKI